MTLAAKYAKLKKNLSGNREQFEFEYGHFVSPEERISVTPLNKWNKRILGELDFAIRLSADKGGVYDACLSKAVDFLTGCVEEDGALTKANCYKAEDMISEIAPAAKEYELLLASHAHIDMNWMWSWHETVAITLATFRTMLSLMEQYPEFTYSQSQASCYKIVEDFDPAMMEQIKARIKEGRWEVTATAWVETDKNMPNTESLLNHIKYTREYLKDRWEIDPATLELDFSPDTFGHSVHLPELDSYGGVNYYYLCRGIENRGDDDDVIFRWKAPSGKEILVYREQYWYNNGILPIAGAGLVEISRKTGGLKTGLIVYGVGDHGGGPTRRDIERAIEMNEWPVFPKMTFGTIREYFKRAEAVRDKLPLLEGEQNFVFPGCYTTQSRVKLGNRRCEAALFEAQLFSSLSEKMAGQPYEYKQFERAWQNVLFTHFHDILTGSCVQDSREHAMGLYSEAIAVAQTQQTNAMRAISENIDYSFIPQVEDVSETRSEGGGAGFGVEYFAGIPNPERGLGKTRVYTAFNPSPETRKGPVEIVLWDWPGDTRYITAEDEKGNPLPIQYIDEKRKDPPIPYVDPKRIPYWDHMYMRYLVEAEIPALGYGTIIIKEAAPEVYAIYPQKDSSRTPASTNYILKNEKLCAEICYKCGELVSLIDVKTGKQLLKQGESGGLRLIDTERNTSSAWVIGKHTNVDDQPALITIKYLNKGELQDAVIMKQKIRDSVVDTIISLDKGSENLRVEFEIDWHEISRYDSQVPVLYYTLPLAYEAKKFLYDVPAGVITRPAMDGDVPALTYGAALSGDDVCVSIATNCKYGYHGTANALSATLINSTKNPDPYPERGIHRISLYIHTGCECPVALRNAAFNALHPVTAQTAYIHKGTLSPKASLLGFSSDTAVLSSVTETPCGKLLIRAYEICGKDTAATVTFPKEVSEAYLADLSGNKVGDVKLNGKVAEFTVSAYSIVTVKADIAK